MKPLWIALLVAGCATHTPLDAPPSALLTCPPPAAVPAPLPRVRTTEQLAAFATALEYAREAERNRADACAERLTLLNRWIRALK